VPRYWVSVSASPPCKRRDDVRAIVELYGAKLSEDQLYFPLAEGGACALIEGPDDPVDAKAMLDHLEARAVVTLLSVDEAEQAFRRGPGAGTTG